MIDFVEMLLESINEKITQCRGYMHEFHNPVYNEVLVEIPILEFVQGRIQDLVTGMVKKTGLYTTIIEFGPGGYLVSAVFQ